MEYQCSPLSCWEFYNQQEGLEDLRHSLVYTTLELEATIVSTKEEITRKECELIHVNDLLSKVMKERDEAREKCQNLMLEKLELQQQLQQQHRSVTKSGSENEPQVTSSDNEENSMPFTDNSSNLQAVVELAEKKPLPEKGKFLKAVVEAGPLLQTLLLAGPLPQWQHPPPQLNSIEIPPVAISSPKPSSLLLLPPPKEYSTKTFSLGKKRGLEIECPVSKCRKVTPTNTSHHFLS